MNYTELKALKNHNTNTAQLIAIAEVVTTSLKMDYWRAARAKLLRWVIQQTRSEYAAISNVPADESRASKESAPDDKGVQ
jgi:hypothetical protein